MPSNSYQASRNSGLSALKIPYSASSHPEKKAQTCKPDWNGCPSMPGRFRGVYRKMVMVNMVFVGLGLAGPGWHGPATGHSIPWFSQML